MSVGCTSRRTLADWVEALRRSGWQGRRVGKKWKGPCPLCGGTGRFEVGPGSRVATVLAYCFCCTPANASQRGEWFKQMAQLLFPREEAWRRTPYVPRTRPQWPQTTNTRTSRGNGARRPDGGTASGGAVVCPACGGSSESDPQIGKRKRCGECRARRMWADARPVSADPNSPARRWAALRKLWRPGDPFPPSLRWLAWQDGGGSLVACFAPLGDWLSGNPDPSGVQLIHIAPNGQPRRDRGGLGKRSHGAMGGSVVLMGEPLSEAGRIHVVEGVADALAVAAREDGAVVAAGGTSGFARLSRDLSQLGVPVVIWPDGDEAGKKAANDLECALRERGAIADTARIPRGHDPASLAGRCFDGSGRWSNKESS